MRVMVIGAHPDDETFGMGGTLARHINQGDQVSVLILTDGVMARHGDIEAQRKAFELAMRLYGVTEYRHCNYPDQMLDTIPLLTLVLEIEAAIRKWQPERIYTHSRVDVGQDHRRVYEATMVAARPTTCARQILSYVCPSSTWWGGEPFKGNYFVDTSGTEAKKIEVINSAYPHEAKHEPHPRMSRALLTRDEWIGNMLCRAGWFEEFELIRWIE